MTGQEIQSEVGLCSNHSGGSGEVDSEVGLCTDHICGSRDQKRGKVVHRSFLRVTRSKARLGRAQTILAGHEIESEVESYSGQSGGSRDRKRG